MLAPDHDYPYRVFLSYAQDDVKDAAQVVNRLRQLNLQPVWDHHNPGGWPFLEEIKNQIDHSHLFIPLLTPNSQLSTWVNHEIGYAMGRNVPVLPLSLGPVPEGMAAGLQATRAQAIQDLLPQLTRPLINRRVEHADTAAVYECADLSDSRTEAIIKHCVQVEALESAHHQPLRHLAAFGSFSIPYDPNDPRWNERSSHWPVTPDRSERLSKERRALQEYARRFGCDLVLYPSLPKSSQRELSQRETQVRIQVLQLFLKEMRGALKPVRVIFDKCGLEKNLIMLGDWFFVESLTPRPEGYRHTTITCHAPTVLKRIEAFDRQFSNCGWLSPDSAIRRLDEEFNR